MNSKSKLRKDLEEYHEKQKKEAERRKEFYKKVDVLLDSGDMPSFKGVTGSFSPDPRMFDINMTIPHDPPMAKNAIEQLISKG